MKIEMNVISRQMITPSSPSSPTPPHLNNYKLSYIDQSMVPFLMPYVFFYPPHPENNPITNSERSNHLKKSLSKALTLFYPLAGRLVNNSYVDCNDEGVTFVEAQANCNIHDVINNPLTPEELNDFIPCRPDEGRDRCLIAQVTSFGCGGLAIGFAITHKLLDALTYFKFFNTWAAFSRGDVDGIESPIFESATLFPPRDSGSVRSSEKVNNENIVAKRFVFNGEMVSKLKEMYSNNTNGEGFIRPTRIETLSAFIWTRFILATRAKEDTSITYALSHNVGIRKKLVPPLSDNHFGNFFLRTFVVASLENDVETKCGVVKKMRDAIRSIDQDYVAKTAERDETLEGSLIRFGVKKDPKDKAVILRFTSLCGFPIYESDFGWGKPVWVASGKLPIKNIVFALDSISGGGGIDAVVHLNEEDMVKFEADEELNLYVTK